jgi:hypothetical protein
LARAPQQRGCAHLAPHSDRVAVGASNLEIQVRVRIHEVDVLDYTLDLDGLRAVETAEAVMAERSGRRSDHRENEQTKRLPHVRSPFAPNVA